MITIAATEYNRYKKSFFIICVTFIFLFSSVFIAYALFDESVNQQQAESEVLDYRAKSAEKYEREKEKISQNAPSAEVVKKQAPGRKKATAADKKSKDTALGVIAILTAGILYFLYAKSRRNTK